MSVKVSQFGSHRLAGQGMS